MKIIKVESCADCMHKENCHEKLDVHFGEIFSCVYDKIIHPDCPLQDASDLISKQAMLDALEEIKDKLILQGPITGYPQKTLVEQAYGVQDAINIIQAMPGVE